MELVVRERFRNYVCSCLFRPKSYLPALQYPVRNNIILNLERGLLEKHCCCLSRQRLTKDKHERIACARSRYN